MTVRSYLFVPGNRPERFDKACSVGADVVLIDLEDAVASADKSAARRAAAEWLASSGTAWLRINGADTDSFQDDLLLLGLPGVQGVMLAKAEETEPIAAIRRAAPVLPVIPLIESARGLWNVEAIATAPGVVRLAFGSVDFQLDLGIAGDREELLMARSQVVLASRVAGLPSPVDGVTMALDDAEALTRDVAYARRLGFGGKLAVHPRQVTAINDGFQSSPDEADWARRVVDAAEAAGGNAFRLDGKLVDRPIIERARAILHTATSRSR
jgi:citrate lyase subunit beta / citryl-CoA lyase